MVRRDAKRPSGEEPRGEGFERHRVQEPALDLLLLWPRIGEIDVKRRDGRREERAQEEGRVGAQDRGVGKPRLRDALPADAEVADPPLHAHEVVLRTRARRRDQEPGLAAPGLDFRGGLVAEERARVERAAGPERFVGSVHSSRSAIARAKAFVPADPPMSGVRTPPAKVARTARSTRPAISSKPMWRSIRIAERRRAVGLARSDPAMSGAVPWTASKIATVGPRFAPGTSPNPPTSPAARSDMMSP